MPTPDIIAHRGASRECYENTIEAFTLALDQGVDGIELDVHGSADGHLVVHHDFVMPVVGADGIVSPRALRDLSLHDIQATRLPGGHSVPLLSEVFELVGLRATVYVEVKAVHVEAAVVALLDRYPGVRVAVHSFDHRIPVAVRSLRPGTPIGFLSDLYPVDLPSLLKPGSPDTLWQHAAMIDEALVRQAHASGVRVIAWTENDPVHARQLASWGVDGLCTDIPAIIRQAVA
jgi:glycerophosphoryl diester phosphodiesterase